jgi:hypothetical protein
MDHETWQRFLAIERHSDPSRAEETLAAECEACCPEKLIRHIADPNATAERVRRAARTLLADVRARHLPRQLDPGTLQHQAVARTMRVVESVCGEPAADGRAFALRYNAAVLQLVEDLYEVHVLMSTDSRIKAEEGSQRFEADLASLKEDYRSCPSEAKLETIRECKRELEKCSFYARVHGEAVDGFFDAISSTRMVREKLVALRVCADRT